MDTVKYLLKEVVNRLVKFFFSDLIEGIGQVIAIGASLLPLSVLLLAYPAINPQESVLQDETSDRRSMLRRLLGRLFALLTAFTVLIVILATSVELVTRFHQVSGDLFLSERGAYAPIARGFLPAPASMMGKNKVDQDKKMAEMPPNIKPFLTTPLYRKLPDVMVLYWPLVILTMYFIDIAILLMMGKVPLAYNLRNVRVRWLTNLMTVLAFVFVIGLLVFLLGFVNGMNNLTENTGVPGNVLVLADGATDELFSNLGYGDLDNVERETTLLNERDERMPKSVGTGSEKINGRDTFLASRETYYVINQPIPKSNPPRRRFVQVRTLEDPEIAAKVHEVKLFDGGKWFSSVGVDGEGRIQCVIGEGVAGTLGADLGLQRVGVGHEFELGDMKWIVTGVMKTDGKTYGSEIWTKRLSKIYKPFGKEAYTTLVLRTNLDTKEASKALAYHLSKRYTMQKLKAFSEPDYYAELTKTNNDFLVAIIAVAVVMAIGGVFAMMTTMFASIAQRIRDIGVLRLLGYKRWQVMLSFMLESMTIAFIGGVLGCGLARLLAHGKGTTSTLSGGGGGPGGKSAAISIDVGFEVVVLGLLFAMIMGRLGGLVPAMSAIRMKVLDSLR